VGRRVADDPRVVLDLLEVAVPGPAQPSLTTVLPSAIVAATNPPRVAAE
jgi:hypothetical protein